jgi:prevent-host-death family protein
MRIAPLADVKARLSAYLEQCEAEGPIVITRTGKAVALLVAPLNPDDLERLLLSPSRRFRALLNKSRRSIKEGRGLSEEAFWKAVGQRSQERQTSQVKRTSRGKRRT